MFSFLKKTIIFLIFAGCCLGCSKRKDTSVFETWMQKNEKVKILSTTAMIHDLVQEIGGEHVDSLTLIIGELDPHSYELVKGDDEKFSFAHIVFYNGLGLEHGASLRYRLEAHPKSIPLAEKIHEMHPETILISKGQKDPHVWMDISIWVHAIDPIVAILSQTDPLHASVYQSKGEELRKKMLRAHEAIKLKMQKIPQEKRFLVTSHDAFNYFTRGYLAEPEELKDQKWHRRFTAPEGLAPDGQLSSADIKEVIKQLCTYQIKVLFSESNVSRDSLKKIVSSCREMGLEVQIGEQALYGDAMGGEGSDADSYLKMIEHNASVLAKAWKSP